MTGVWVTSVCSCRPTWSREPAGFVHSPSCTHRSTRADLAANARDVSGEGWPPSPGTRALPVLAVVLDVARAGSDQEHVRVLAAAVPAVAAELRAVGVKEDV